MSTAQTSVQVDASDSAKGIVIGLVAVGGL